MSYSHFVLVNMLGVCPLGDQQLDHLDSLTNEEWCVAIWILDVHVCSFVRQIFDQLPVPIRYCGMPVKNPDKERGMSRSLHGMQLNVS